jgi:hypothetical protein
MPGIWKREQNGCYYVQLGNRQVNLGTDQKAAKKTYHRLLSRGLVEQPSGGFIDGAEGDRPVHLLDRAANIRR